MRVQLSRLGVAVAAVATAACGEKHNEPSLAVTDSAGIAIVTNARSFSDLPVRPLAGEFEHEIVDDALYQVTAIQILPYGGLAVAATGSGSVLRFDSTGRRTAQLGRMGDGPGEFRSIQSLVQLPGDSLAVYDPRSRRVTVLPLKGGEPRVLSLHDLAPDRGWSRVHPLPEGLAFVGEAGLGGRGDSGVYRKTASSFRIDLGGEVLTEYGEFPGLEAFAGGGMMGRAPFGALLATVTLGDQLVVGTGEHAELRMYDPTGALSRIVRWVDEDRIVSEERAAQFVEFLVSQGPPEQANEMRARIRDLPLAPVSPTHVEVLATPGGGLWVGEYPGPEIEMPTGRRLAARRWVVFDADGVMQERVETEAGFMPMLLVQDLVWGVYFNDLDVESLRAYRIGSE